MQHDSADDWVKLCRPCAQAGMQAHIVQSDRAVLETVDNDGRTSREVNTRLIATTEVNARRLVSTSYRTNAETQRN